MINGTATRVSANIQHLPCKNCTKNFIYCAKHCSKFQHISSVKIVERKRERKKYRSRSWATPSAQKLIKLCDWMHWIRTIGWEFYALLSTLFNDLIHLHIKWSYFFRFVCSILLHTWANGMSVLVCTTAWLPVRVYWARTYMVACAVACVRHVCNTYWILKNETMKIKID